MVVKAFYGHSVFKCNWLHTILSITSYKPVIRNRKNNRNPIGSVLRLTGSLFYDILSYFYSILDFINSFPLEMCGRRNWVEIIKTKYWTVYLRYAERCGDKKICPRVKRNRVWGKNVLLQIMRLFIIYPACILCFCLRCLCYQGVEENYPRDSGPSIHGDVAVFHLETIRQVLCRRGEWVSEKRNCHSNGGIAVSIILE